MKDLTRTFGSNTYYTFILILYINSTVNLFSGRYFIKGNLHILILVIQDIFEKFDIFFSKRRQLNMLAERELG